MLWAECQQRLQDELKPDEFGMYIRPLQVQESDTELRLFAPNRFVADWVRERFVGRIRDITVALRGEQAPAVIIDVGDQRNSTTAQSRKPEEIVRPRQTVSDPVSAAPRSNVDPQFVFANFVEGKSNSIAKAAAMQAAMNPAKDYNPLFIYGGTGLGKTHLMQAVGNLILQKNPAAKVVYVRSERYVQEMVKALQTSTMEQFKRFYRSVDCLLVDDIQFFARADFSQEEFFHNFNSLFESAGQIVLTCDQYPKEVNGLDERLKSRFGWGLAVAVDPPELETRVAILQTKAEKQRITLEQDVAFFIGKRIRSNVRELEGALNKVTAYARFTGHPISIELCKEALRDLIAAQEKMVTVENIQKTVAEYYRIKLSDLMSKRRSRSVARPRQVAMALSKELTNHSLPEIGESFGGKDHTTVLHACRKIKELRDGDRGMSEDYANLLRILQS